MMIVIRYGKLDIYAFFWSVYFIYYKLIALIIFVEHDVLVSMLSAVIQHTMGGSTLSIVLVAMLLISTLSHCSAENVYCVTPIAISCSSCPHNSTH